MACGPRLAALYCHKQIQLEAWLLCHICCTATSRGFHIYCVVITCVMFQKHPELQRKVEQLETRLELAEAQSLQLEDALHMSDKDLHALKDDKRNLQVCRQLLSGC